MIRRLLHKILNRLNSDGTLVNDTSVAKPATLETSLIETIDPSENPLLVGQSDRIYGGWFNQENDEIYPGIKIESHQTIIDIGCGDGRAIKFCSQRKAHVIFMDLNETKIKRLEKELNNTNAGKVDGIVGDCTAIDIKDNTGDIIICTEVLEHVDDPVKVMTELARIGKPDAIYILTVPDPAGEALMKVTAPPIYFKKPNHIRIFEREEFRSLATNAGLKITEQSYHGAYWCIFWIMQWSTGKPMSGPWDPMVKHWAKTWSEVLAHPNGDKIKAALEEAIPKSQVIIAKKT
jgi:2-polyprenyl-3-methyl-5-hydroxy-6-metoxy-1,4-benzoquinol methylase